MNLLKLAQTFDGLDPESSVKQRVDLSEQMKEQLGDRIADFEVRYETLLTAGSQSPAATALQQMGLDKDTGPFKPVWRIDFYIDEDRVHAILRSTIAQAAEDALSQPESRDRVGAALAEHVTDAIFRMIADGPTMPRDEPPAQVAARYLGRTGAQASAAPTVAHATAAYRHWRALAQTSQVSAPELAAAAQAFTTARDALMGTPAAAELQAAVVRIEAEILEARRRPQLHPNQLPGARRVQEKR